MARLDVLREHLSVEDPLVSDANGDYVEFKLLLLEHIVRRDQLLDDVVGEYWHREFS
jgi:hypothetical protein